MSTIMIGECCGEGVGWYGMGSQAKMAMRVDCKVATGIKDDAARANKTSEVLLH